MAARASRSRGIVRSVFVVVLPVAVLTAMALGAVHPCVAPVSFVTLWGMRGTLDYAYVAEGGATVVLVEEINRRSRGSSVSVTRLTRLDVATGRARGEPCYWSETISVRGHDGDLALAERHHLRPEERARRYFFLDPARCAAQPQTVDDETEAKRRRRTPGSGLAPKVGSWTMQLVGTGPRQFVASHGTRDRGDRPEFLRPEFLRTTVTGAPVASDDAIVLYHCATDEGAGRCSGLALSAVSSDGRLRWGQPLLADGRADLRLVHRAGDLLIVAAGAAGRGPLACRRIDLRAGTSAWVFER